MSAYFFKFYQNRKLMEQSICILSKYPKRISTKKIEGNVTFLTHAHRIQSPRSDN